MTVPNHDFLTRLTRAEKNGVKEYWRASELAWETTSGFSVIAVQENVLAALAAGLDRIAA
jgi:hypothetical protein